MSEELLNRIEGLERQLEEAEETIHAIRHGEVDAIVNKSSDSVKITPFNGADFAYHIMLHAADEGMATISTNGNILYANQSLMRMLEFDTEGLTQYNIKDFIRKDAANPQVDILELASAIGKKELLILNRSGVEIPVIATFRILDKDGGQAISIVITDLRERKQKETEIQRLNEKLLEINRGREALALGISDDLRIPLFSVVALTKDRLCQDVSNAEKQYLASILKYSRSLLSSLAEIKDFAMIEAGKVVPSPESLIINDALSQTLSMFTSNPDYLAMKINLAVPSQNLLCRTDRRILLKLMWNLFSKSMQLSSNEQLNVSLAANKDRGNNSILFEIGFETSLNSQQIDDLVRFFTSSVYSENTLLGLHRSGFYLLASLTALCGAELNLITKTPKHLYFTLRLPLRGDGN